MKTQQQVGHAKSFIPLVRRNAMKCTEIKAGGLFKHFTISADIDQSVLTLKERLMMKI